MTTRLAALMVLIVMLPVAPAFAADEQAGPPAANLVWGGSLAPRPATPPSQNLVWGGSLAPRPALSRPMVLPTLYAGYAALQAYDIYSTRQAVKRGAVEANPLMQGVVGNTGAFVALKAGVATGTILAAERLWKNDKKAAAIGVMVASTAVSAIVAGRNARTLSQLR